MKNIIIRIQDISDIDTSKISVYDLNNRYIDKQGEMYGLKYNPAIKRVEVIKLRRAHASEAALVTQQLQKKKIDEKEKAVKDNKVKPANVPLPSASEKKKPAVNFDGDSFIKEMNELASTHKSRLTGIISNLQKSNYIKEADRADKISLEAYFRSINTEALQKFEKLEKNQKELLYYPRSIPYYLANLDNQGREFIDRLNQDNQKIMKFIYYFEMLSSMRIIYRQIRKVLDDLIKFLASLEEKKLKELERNDKLAYQDAVTSINNTLIDCERTLDDLSAFEAFIYDIEKY